MTKRLSRLWPALLLTLCYILSVGFFARYGMHNLDADMSSEMIYAAMQNEEGTLLSPNWYYSSEIRTISPVPFYQLTLALGLPWHAARTLAIALILAGATAAFLYIARPLGLSAGGLYLAAILVLPFSQPYGFAEIFGCMYQPYVAMTFICFGLVLRLGRDKGRLRRLVLLALLGFWSGTVGVRLLMMCAAPLALACALHYLALAKDCERLGETRGTEQLWQLAGTALLCLCMGLGYLVNIGPLAAKYDFVRYGDAAVIAPDCEHVFGQLGLLAEFFGFRQSTRLISLRGVMSVCALGMLVLAFICLAVQLMRKKGRLFALFALFSLAVGVMVNVLTDMWFVRYYMPAALMLIIVIDKCWADTPCRLRMLRVFAPTALAAVFLLQTSVFLREEQRTEPADYELTAQWLMERGLRTGYATFWNGAMLTEVTDGAIEIYAMPDSIWQDDWKRLALNDFLQDKRHFDTMPEGEVFVLLSDEEAAQEDVPYADRAHRVGRSPMGPVYVYESAKALHDMLNK